MPRFVNLVAPAAAALLGCSGTSDGGPGPTDPDSNNSLVCTIPTDRIFSGGVARDGIPALTNP